MGEFGTGLVIGVLVTYLAFAAMDFTPAVYNHDAYRATEVCSKSAWVRIDRSTIYCQDSAEYPRKEEDK